MLNLEIYVTKNCPSCSRVLRNAHSFIRRNPQITLKITDIFNSRKRISIVPAVFLNENLICYGEFRQDIIKRRIGGDLK